MTSGVFITLEGGDGAGKSTQIRLLDKYLTKRDISHLMTREPGGSIGAEEIRHILKSGSMDKWDAVSETLLFSAARRSHLQDTVKPSIAAGKWVVSDRFADSTLAYQGYGRKTITQADLKYLYHLIAGDFEPTLTFILDIDPTKGMARLSGRGTKDRIEKMDMSFHHDLRKGFLEIAKQNPHRCVVIDADRNPHAVHRAIVKIIEERLQ